MKDLKFFLKSFLGKMNGHGVFVERDSRFIGERTGGWPGWVGNNGGEGGIRTHVPAHHRQDDFESSPLRPLRYLSAYGYRVVTWGVYILLRVASSW